MNVLLIYRKYDLNLKDLKIKITPNPKLQVMAKPNRNIINYATPVFPLY